MFSLKIPAEMYPRLLRIYLLYLGVIFKLKNLLNLRIYKKQLLPQLSTNQIEIMGNGAWNWFTEPRALRFKGKKDQTYLGFVNNSGDIVIQSINHATNLTKNFLLQKNLGIDDHNNPAILIRNDGRIMVFYSHHSGANLYYRISNSTEDISSFSTEMKIDTNSQGNNGFTYPNPLELTAENNKLFLFWRGADWQPTFSTSADLGLSWTKAQTLINVPHHRPYVKYKSNGKNGIHIAFSEGHPRNFNTSIYYVFYKNGSFYKADGTFIKNLSDLPLAPAEADIVYDYQKTGIKSWVWDIAFDKKDQPVIVYATFPSEKNHHYYYAVRENLKWKNNFVTQAGSYIDGPSEKQYSGGITLDHQNTSTVFFSKEVNGIHEIEKGVTSDSGKSWKFNSITQNSRKKNVRPVVAWSNVKNTPEVFWMYGDYTHYLFYNTFILRSV